AAVRPVRAVAVRRFFYRDGQVGGTVPGALAVGCLAVAAPAQRDGPAAAPAAPSAADPGVQPVLRHPAFPAAGRLPDLALRPAPGVLPARPDHGGPVHRDQPAHPADP